MAKEVKSVEYGLENIWRSTRFLPLLGTITCRILRKMLNSYYYISVNNPGVWLETGVRDRTYVLKQDKE
jgi:hypothetical protein